MGGAVEIPVWIAIIVGALAVVGALDRILAPSVRWFFRKRLNRAIDKLNMSLDLKLPAFKMTRRQVLIDRLVYDPELLDFAEDYAEAEGAPREVVVARIERYAREMAPAFSATAYFSVGARLARWVSQALYRVRLGYVEDAALSAVPRHAAVVFVMNHRSNMDYVLVTYLASRRAALSYAVGEWAQVWGLRTLIRSMGAYFVRRDSRDALYRKVLSRYVRMATEGGVAQAVFPEGGLSRDGALRPPKLGLLSYIVAGFDPNGARDVVFVPIGINYDRVLEDRVLLGSAAGSQARPHNNAGPLSALKFLAHLIRLRLGGRYHRFGYACVTFGAPISLRAFLERRPRPDVAMLGEELMRRIGEIVPALPVSLVARALAESDAETLTEAALTARVRTLIATLKAAGAHLHIPRDNPDYAAEVGLRMLRMRGIVATDPDGRLRVAPEEAPLLRYYANAIAHLGR